MHVLDAVDAATLRKDVPSFRPGDEIKVHVRVIEGNKSRIQVFQGVVIRRSGGQVEVPACQCRIVMAPHRSTTKKQSEICTHMGGCHSFN